MWLHSDCHCEDVEHCSLIPGIMATVYQTVTWLHWPHTLLMGIYYLPWGLCRNLATRHLVGNSTVTTWADTRYPVFTRSLCRNKGGTDTKFCSLRLVPLVGERVVTTSSLSCVSQHNDYMRRLAVYIFLYFVLIHVNWRKLSIYESHGHLFIQVLKPENPMWTTFMSLMPQKYYTVEPCVVTKCFNFSMWFFFMNCCFYNPDKTQFVTNSFFCPMELCYNEVLVYCKLEGGTQQNSSCSHCAVTGQWRCGDYSFTY